MFNFSVQVYENAADMNKEFLDLDVGNQVVQGKAVFIDFEYFLQLLMFLLRHALIFVF